MEQSELGLEIPGCIQVILIHCAAIATSNYIYKIFMAAFARGKGRKNTLELVPKWKQNFVDLIVVAGFCLLLSSSEQGL